MKIMFIGAATSNHTMRWVNALSEKGHEVLLVSRGDQVDIKNHISANVKIEYLKHGGKLGYYLNIRQLRDIFKKFAPDVVNAHYASGYGLLARLAKVKPLVISCWGSDVYDFPYRSKFNYKTLIKNFDYADAIASTSIAMAEQVKKLLKSSERTVTVTPFGVDINKFTPKKENNSQVPTVGIVKYMEPIYDIPLLLNGFAKAYGKLEIKPRLHIYGGGTLLEEMKELAKSLGIENSVQFFGTIPNYDVPKAIQGMDVFVNCSKQESFGVALVEAMACGVPVIATDTEGFREVVVNNETGIVLQDRDPNTMAEAIITLLTNEGLRMAYGSAGRRRVVENYDWDKNVDTMITLYQTAMKGRV